MSGAVVNADGGVRQLDARADAPICITAEDVKDAEKLARLLQQALRENAEMRRRHVPVWRDFEDVEIASGSYSFPHGFRGRVRWWIADWRPGTPGDALVIERSEDTTNDTLILLSDCSGTVTVRIEEVP
jgi:hypothetical protein